MFRSTLRAAGVAASLVLAAHAQAQALEPFKAYDNFNASTIDADRWNNFETLRSISGKKLRLSQRGYANVRSNTGTNAMTLNQPLPNPSDVTAMRATITVNAVQARGCSANSAPTDSRARLYGQFFNTGTPEPGSLLGDMTAQVRVVRRSNSKDASNLLRVEGNVFRCGDPACVAGTTIGQVDLGTVRLRSPVQVQMVWDKAGNRFLFSRDGRAARAVRYTSSDSAPASMPIAQLSVRNIVPNCTRSSRPTSFIDATFDNLSVNRSAPP